MPTESIFGAKHSKTGQSKHSVAKHGLFFHPWVPVWATWLLLEHVLRESTASTRNLGSIIPFLFLCSFFPPSLPSFQPSFFPFESPHEAWFKKD